MSRPTFSLKKVLIIALLLRLFLSPLTYHDDVTTNYWWGVFAVNFHLRGYYDWLNFGGYVKPDQPPLYIWYYRDLRQIYQFFYQIFWYLNLHFPIFPSKFMTWYFLFGNQYLEKVPIIFVDLILIVLLYRFCQKYFSQKKAEIAALILALYPPLIVNSALWGGNDSLVNLLGLTSLYLLFRRKTLPAIFLLTLCLLFKSSLIYFLPITLVIFLKNRPSFLTFIFSLAIALATIYLVCRPFAISATLPWFFNFYLTKVMSGAMPQLTANAFNFWSLIFGISPLPDTTVRPFALVATTIFIAIICVRLWKNYRPSTLLFSLVSISLFCFCFLTRMHERYTFPCLIPLLLLCFYHHRLWPHFIFLTLSHLLNLYHWWYFPRLPLLVSFVDSDLTIRLLSLGNLVVLFSLLFQYRSNRHTLHSVP